MRFLVVACCAALLLVGCGEADNGGIERGTGNDITFYKRNVEGTPCVIAVLSNSIAMSCDWGPRP